VGKYCYVASARRCMRRLGAHGGGEGRGILCRHAHSLLLLPRKCFIAKSTAANIQRCLTVSLCGWDRAQFLFTAHRSDVPATQSADDLVAAFKIAAHQTHTTSTKWRLHRHGTARRPIAQLRCSSREVNNTTQNPNPRPIIRFDTMSRINVRSKADRKPA